MLQTLYANFHALLKIPDAVEKQRDKQELTPFHTSCAACKMARAADPYIAVSEAIRLLAWEYGSDRIANAFISGLVDTDPDLATMFLLQAAKFKPELAQKHWGGDALATLKDVLGADDAQEQVSTAARGRLWPRCVAHTDGAVLQE